MSEQDTERRIATANNIAVKQRNYRRARDRALARLANAYPDDYKELLEQERATDERMGKKWLDITGSTAAGNVDTRADSAFVTARSSNGAEDEGNRGGEA